jgi:hypothetical protein
MADRYVIDTVAFIYYPKFDRFHYFLKILASISTKNSQFLSGKSI